MKIIIVPHPDDEFFVLEELKKGIDEVVYVVETCGGRDVEAINVAKHYKFRPVFCHGLLGLEAYLMACKKEFTIIAPLDVIGDHPMHRLVANLVERAREHIEFDYVPYVIDVDNLSIADKELIAKFYPSQKWILYEEMII